MQNRQKTLWKNVGIFALFPLLALSHGWFWGMWLKGAKAHVLKLTGEHKELISSVERLRNDTNAFKLMMQKTQEDLDARQKELEDLGPFLPHIRDKPEMVRKILILVESMGIRINNTDFPQAESSREGGGGYYTVNFTLELIGPYRAFKQLLAKIQQTSMIIRINAFKVEDFGMGNPAYDWRVKIQFQTYFGS